MKRIICFVLATILTCFLSMSSFASNPITTGTGSDTADVKAKYVDSTTQPNVYSVDIAWGAMEFTYTDAGVNTWDPETHTYSETKNVSWSANGNTVKVTNHSNIGIGASFSYTSLSGYSTVTGSFDKTGVQTLAAGVVDQPGKASSVTAKLTLSGSVADTLTSFTKVGTVTVSLTPIT